MDQVEPIRIVIADDHPIVRRGLCALIDAQPDMSVVGEAATSQEAEFVAGTSHPDMVLLDWSMPGPEATQTIPRICERAPGTRVLILTMHDDEAYARSAFSAGAAGYVVKRASDTEFTQAIRAVSEGRAYLDGTLAAALLRSEYTQDLESSDEASGPEHQLSAREWQVLQLIARGYTQKEIATRLHVSVKSVETYRARLSEKLDLHSRSDLVRYAVTAGLLERDTMPPPRPSRK